MTSLSISRGYLTAALAVTVGALFSACTEEEPTPSNSPIVGGGTTAGGAITGGVLPGGPATGGTPGTGGPSSGGMPGTGAVPGGGTTAGPTGGTGGTAGTGGLPGGVVDSMAGVPCAVRKVVQDRCSTCHGAVPVSGAPMPLVTLADWQAMSKTAPTQKYWEVSKVRVNATTNAMPPIGTLSAEEKSTLNGWLDAGAPASTETCQPDTSGGMPGGSSGADIDTTGLECYKLLAHARGSKTAKYRVGTAVDKYINFGFQAPWQGDVYGIIVKPVIDNAQVLHHWLLYREQVADGSVEETIGQHAGGELIHGWAPGGIAMDFRKHESGFELPATTYSVELHYNSSDPNAEDASGVELCVQREKPKNVSGMSWLGYDQGGVLSYASGICLTPATSWTGTCRPAAQTGPIHMIFLTPHLHEAGRHLKAVINGPNGTRVLHDEPFNFAYQITYETDEVLMPGETITTTCTYSEPKCAGQSTTQEMCYLFTYAYPKGALVDNGLEGTFMHGEGVCLGQ